MFRGGHRGRTKEYGADLETVMEISLEEAAKGAKKDVSYHRSKACSRCKGSRSEPGSTKKTCSTCRGNGQVQQARRAGPMAFYTVTTCRDCRGEGSVVEKPCKSCGGSGKISSNEHIRVDIPPGIQGGMGLRLGGLGEYGPDGPGDLFVKVHVRSHDIFERKGNDLWLDMPISFSRAALGGTVEVPTLFGKAKLRVPAGTASHTVFRLKEEGMPHLNRKTKGDEMVRVVIDVPKKLTKKQKELLRKLDKGYKKKKGLFDSILGVFF